MDVTLTNFTSVDMATGAMSKCYGKACNTNSLIKACKAGHWSLLEHLMVAMDVTCSQKVLAQLSRHRHFSFTVQSTRGMDITGNGFFRDFGSLTSEEQALLSSAYGTSALMFQNLVARGIPLETASYVLPLGTNVQLKVSGNLRCWLEYLKQRLCKRASEEHQLLARAMWERLQFAYPTLCTLDLLGMCENCKELSCDFTSHSKKIKTPVRKELEEEK